MTDQEISKALALAIGWPKEDVAFHNGMVRIEPNSFGWRVFDHTDWNVIGPIAERYNCFPTPQKAIALAVIQGAKK